MTASTLSLSLSRSLTLALSPLLLAPMLSLSGCSRASAGTKVSTASQRQVDSARQQMELIPPPSKTRYMSIHDLESWENPYLTVQQNIITLHVTLADANTSGLGAGGLLRPTGARRQDLNISTESLPDALSAIPQNSWPYGRVVAVEEAHNTPTTAEPSVRRNVEAAIKTLNDMGVVVDEWNGSR